MPRNPTRFSAAAITLFATAHLAAQTDLRLPALEAPPAFDEEGATKPRPLHDTTWLARFSAYGADRFGRRAGAPSPNQDTTRDLQAWLAIDVAEIPREDTPLYLVRARGRVAEFASGRRTSWQERALYTGDGQLLRSRYVDAQLPANTYLELEHSEGQWRITQVVKTRRELEHELGEVSLTAPPAVRCMLPEPIDTTLETNSFAWHAREAVHVTLRTEELAGKTGLHGENDWVLFDASRGVEQFGVASRKLAFSRSSRSAEELDRALHESKHFTLAHEEACEGIEITNKGVHLASVDLDLKLPGFRESRLFTARGLITIELKHQKEDLLAILQIAVAPPTASLDDDWAMPEGIVLRQPSNAGTELRRPKKTKLGGQPALYLQRRWDPAYAGEQPREEHVFRMVGDGVRYALTLSAPLKRAKPAQSLARKVKSAWKQKPLR